MIKLVVFDFGPGQSPWIGDGPAAITFHDGRMWMGANIENPAIVLHT